MFDLPLARVKDEVKVISIFDFAFDRDQMCNKSNFSCRVDIAKPQEEGELPKATYHRQCRSIFTLERNLDKLSQLDAKERANCNSTDSRRSSIRQPTANPGRIYQRVCIFCEKDKYTRNSRTTEEQCVDMHADETIRKAAAGKCEALYHKSCYRNQCTRNISVTGDKKQDSEYTEYFQAELQGYDYIRTDLLQNLRILRLSELYALSTSFVNSRGERECRIVLLQDSRLNPFNPDLQDLFCLSSGKVASSEVQDLDLLRAKEQQRTASRM